MREWVLKLPLKFGVIKCRKMIYVFNKAEYSLMMNGILSDSHY